MIASIVNNKIKILHLEDLRTDAELVERELKRSGMTYEIVVVDNEKDFIFQLSEFSPDIILSDHSLPTFTSLGALKVLRERKITIPFILITSTTSEEFAVNVMKEGAWDYILKDRLQRLPSAITMVLEKHQSQEAKRKVEQELETAHQRLLFHIENSTVGFIEWDNQFIVKNWSKRTEEIFGWTLQEYQALQATGFTAVYEEDYPIAIAKSQELLSGTAHRNHFQQRVKTKSGKVIWCEWFNSVLKNDLNEVITIMSLVRDITEQKLISEKVEENEKRFRALIENITDGIVISNENSRIVYQSPSVERILGYSEQERYNQSLRDYIHPDYRDAYITLLNSVVEKKGIPHPFEFPIRHKNGNYIWLEGISTNLLDDPSVKGVVANYRDVTQRKMLNDILREYNDRHEIVSKATNDAIWDWDIQKDVEIWNHGTETIFGYTEREVSSSRAWWKDKIHPDDYELVSNSLEDAFGQQSNHWTYQYRYRCANGDYKYVLDRAFILYIDDRPIRMIGAMQDITKRVVAEKKLRLLNERYEIVLDTTGDAIWDWDLMSESLTWGEGLLTLFGYKVKGEVHDSFWYEKIHEEDQERIGQSIQKILSSKNLTKWEDEYRFRKSDGTYAVVHDRGAVLRDEDGKVIRMVGSMQDITERKLAVEEIEKLSIVASKTDNIVIITDAKERIEWVNESFVKLTGYTLKEVVGQNPRILQGPGTDHFTTSRIRKKLDAKQPIIEEILNYSKEGDKYWLRLNINPVFNENGDVSRFIAVETDITQQKEYEANIIAIARELTDLMENANVPIFGIDRNGYINEWNKITETISGYSKNEALGKKWFEFIDVRIQKKAKAIIEDAFLGKYFESFELSFQSKFGKKSTILMSISTRKDSNNNVTGVLCVGQDLTEVIQYREGLEKLVEERTQELNQALKKEKELVEMKSKFVSIASHEFRTPLSTIALATGFIRKYKNKISLDEIDKKLDNIEKQVNQMVYLLDDVLLVGKADAGKMKVTLSKIETGIFEKLAKEVVESLKTTHQLQFETDYSVKFFISDEKLIRNIIINLITNAVKFSPGAATIDMTVRSFEDEILIIVKDHGIGIPEEDISTLFESFQRGSNVGTISGTGLGLSIVKKAVELLNGIIEVNSKVNVGSEFIIRLPMG